MSIVALQVQHLSCSPILGSGQCNLLGGLYIVLQPALPALIPGIDADWLRLLYIVTLCQFCVEVPMP